MRTHGGDEEVVGEDDDGDGSTQKEWRNWRYEIETNDAFFLDLKLLDCLIAYWGSSMCWLSMQ